MLWSNWPSPIPHPSLPPTSRKIYSMLSTEVCFTEVFISPSHKHHFMVFSLKDSCLISTPSCPTPALASNIYNFFISNFSPQVPFFPITYHYHLSPKSPNMYATFFFHILYLNAVTTFETNPNPQQYHFQVYSARSQQQKHIEISVRFL